MMSMSRAGPTPVAMGPDPSVADFFGAASDAFRRAQAQAGAIERFFRLGDAHVRLCFAGPDLAPGVLRALAHLPSSPPVTRPDFSIRLWDSASTGTRMPSPPWSNDDYGPHGVIRGLNEGRFRAMFQWYCHALHLIDLETNEALFWVRSSLQVPPAEAGAPLRPLFQMWAAERGMVLVHAAAVGHREGGVLLAGASGAGKSTSSLACLPSALGFLGDDTCLLKGGASIRSLSLYSTGRTDDDGLVRLPFLTPWVSNPVRPIGEKALCFLAEHAARKLVTQFPVRAILVPRRSETTHSRLRPASPGAVLAALAPSTLLQFPGASQASFDLLATAARQIPGYHLDVGTRIEGISETILGLLETQAQRSA